MDNNEITVDLSLETWMNDLPDQLKDMPLIYLAIPGSHDSMTYGITRDSKLAPDAEPILRKLFPIFQGTLLRWTITQSYDAWQQLLIGIRYLDLRLATMVDDHSFYFTHGLYAEEISIALNQVKEFVDTHPGEVVILDCQHFYGFTPRDHKHLIRYLLNLYGPRLVPRPYNLKEITLNYLNRLEMQVIVVYRNDSVRTTEEFWLRTMFPTPWPNKNTVPELLTYFDNVKRNPNTGFVHQAVLTPTAGFIVKRWKSNLRAKCAVPIVNEVLPELALFNSGPPVSSESDDEGRAPINVVIGDFVEMDDAIFTKTIIGLNVKLLRDMGRCSSKKVGRRLNMAVCKCVCLFLITFFCLGLKKN